MEVVSGPVPFVWQSESCFIIRSEQIRIYQEWLENICQMALCLNCTNSMLAGAQPMLSSTQLRAQMFKVCFKFSFVPPCVIHLSFGDRARASAYKVHNLCSPMARKMDAGSQVSGPLRIQSVRHLPGAQGSVP